MSHGDDSGSTTQEIWIHDLGGRPPRRLVSGNLPGLPTFSPDGRTVYFVSHEFDQGRGPNLYSIASDGSQSEATPLLGEPYYPRHPLAPSPDGTEFLFWGRRDQATGWDILALPLGDDPTPYPMVQSPASDSQAEFSPDGRWIAYRSSREGSDEVYAQPYPDGAAQRVSSAGGSDPVWSRSGDEMFYRNGDALMAVAVGRDAPTLTFGPPQRLFELDGWPSSSRGHSYDVAPDGRFLLPEMDPAATGSRGRMTAVVNWGDEVKRLVPVP